MASQRAIAASGVLRTLWTVIGAHRLYPGRLDQPGFLQAVERVRDAAEQATATGPLHVDVRGGRLLVAGEELSRADAALAALAAACFERRVEHVRVLHPPQPRELAAVAVLLSTPPEELEAAGGVEVAARRAGLRAITLGAVAPDTEQQEGGRGLDPATRELWELVSHPERFVANLVVEGLPTDVVETAQRIHRRLASVHAGLPAEVIGREAMFANVARILELMPAAVRHEILSIAITHLQDDGFSAELLNSLTDGQLATWLVELGDAQGPDPVDLVARIAGDTQRRSELLGLVRAERGITAEQAEGPPSMAAMARAPGDAAAGPVATAVADALGRRLLDRRSRDVAEIVAAYPSTPTDGRILAVTALRDYLAAEIDVDRAEEVLRNWADAVRESAAAGDLADLEVLLETVAGPLADADPQKQLALRRGVASVLDRRLLTELLALGRTRGERNELRSLVSFLGGIGVDELLDALADEQDPGRRSQLVTLLAELVPDHLDRIAGRLDDPRWFVARNVVTILGRSGDRAVLPVLVGQLEHPDPRVRRGLVPALVAAGGPDAVTWLRRLVRDGDPDVRTAAVGALAGITTDAAADALADVVRDAALLDDRRVALDRLAAHLAPATPQLLRQLASRGRRPRLPRSLRRAARDAARRREEAR